MTRKIPAMEMNSTVQVRTVVFRGFLDEGGGASSTTLKFITDARSEKMSQSDIAEVRVAVQLSCGASPRRDCAALFMSQPAAA